VKKCIILHQILFLSTIYPAPVPRFLDYIKKEINESYRERLYLAVMILTRKLIECIIHRIFEIVFRERDENGNIYSKIINCGMTQLTEKF